VKDPARRSAAADLLQVSAYSLLTLQSFCNMSVL